MPLWQKVITTVWTTIIVAPVLLAFFAYATTECGEYDRCSEGGWLLYAPIAMSLFGVTSVLQIGFLTMVWKGSPKAETTN